MHIMKLFLLMFAVAQGKRGSEAKKVALNPPSLYSKHSFFYEVKGLIGVLDG